MSLETLYQEILLDHYKRPRNKGVLPHASVHGGGVNPFCGDRIDLYLRLEEDRVVDVRFQGEGCAISQASASMLTEAIHGKTVEEIRAFAARVEKMLKGEEGDELDGLGDVQALQGVRKFPVRIKCALLAWKVLQDALGEYLRNPA
jgi:nitrogen fixation NifU-like protein